MSKHNWNADHDEDVRRLVDSQLPKLFWEALDGIEGRTFEPKPESFDVDGDTIMPRRSYLEVHRDGKRIASLSKKIIIRVAAVHRQRSEAADAESKAKDLASRIVWEP